MILLPIKISDISTPEAAQRILETVKLEETMTGAQVKLDPKPSFLAFSCSLSNVEPNNTVFAVLSKMRRATQWQTRSTLREYMAKGLAKTDDPVTFGELLNNFGTDRMSSGKPEVVRAWMHSIKVPIPSRTLSVYAALPYTTVREVLDLVARMDKAYSRSIDQVINVLYGRNIMTTEEQREARVMMCAAVRADAISEDSTLRDVSNLPRKLVGDTLVIELPTPDTHTLRELLDR